MPTPDGPTPGDAGQGEESLRLAAVIDRQRQELEQARRAAAARSVTDLAAGVLIERLGCSATEAASQLAALAREANTPVAEIAAAIISPGAGPPAVPGAGPPAGPGTSPDSADGRPRSAPLPSDAVLRNQLAGAAGALAADGSELAAAVLEQALAPLGAAAVVLWLLGADGSLGLLGEAGLGPAEASRWRSIPPQMDCLEQRVASSGADLWRPGPAAGDLVTEGPPPPVVGHWPDGARTVIALHDRASALLGVMEVCWPAPYTAFPSELCQQVADLARACAQLLSARVARGELTVRSRPGLRGLLGGLLETVLVASPVRDGTGAVTDFRVDHATPGDAGLAGRTLVEAYPVAAMAGGLLDRAVQALATGQPQFLPGPVSRSPAREMTGVIADVRIARFFDGVVITWRIATEADRLTALLGQIQRLGRIGGWQENLLTGQPDWTDAAFGLFGLPAREGTAISLADLHSYVIGADMPALREFRDTLLRTGRPASTTFRIVRADDGSVRQIRVFAEPVLGPAGTAESVRGAFQDITTEYQTRVVLAATQDQLADSEQRAEEEHLLAVRLQRAILPPSAQPVEAAGIEVAVRYRPAGPGHLVGGDWYDTLLLPSKDVLLVVGDIAGHGIDAVTGMVAARNCLRGLAITGAGPGELLAYLNSAICHLIDGVVGTVVCGLYRPSTRTLRWARGGHLPPVLIRDGQATSLPLPQGVLLGSDPDARYEEFITSLAIGDTMLLFTDGLIERRDIPITDALDEFALRAAQPFQTAARASAAQPSAARLADHVLAHAASDTGDDACLAVVRIR
ncbi:MAG TPA: SpoIIE family protein phosphatase [Streptosporangiaceae bacterium]|nr:SpoIIE family protein phosphatase [Streptosporangiaceae bacterium]